MLGLYIFTAFIVAGIIALIWLRWKWKKEDNMALNARKAQMERDNNENS